MLPSQRLDAYAFAPGRLRQRLRLTARADRAVSESPQLTYLASYVGSLGCRSILIERHYIDRDYIEDHSLFYSRSLYPYDNFCQRVHFFGTTVAQTNQRFRDIQRAAIQGEDVFLEAASEFSKSSYLGFSVIKPLAGSPVGRTVLKTYSIETDDGQRREFTCVRRYEVHVNGVPLEIEGLPFQQQDVGVSACATTAIWTSIQKARAQEELPPATPAQITTLASRYTLPFGRAFPADEGLSVDQMCQAVQGLGLSPHLYSAEDFETTRSYIYTALRSNMSPVLIMKYSGADLHHAVAAVGMRLARSHSPMIPSVNGIDDVASDLHAIYIHDDRTGPYLRANLALTPEGWLRLDLMVQRNPDKIEPWIVTHVLVPCHPKIRLSFGSLRELSTDLSGWVQKASEDLWPTYDWRVEPVTAETWITRPHKYLRELYFQQGILPTDSAIRNVIERVPFPRYVGVTRLRTRRTRPIDVLLDTTSTSNNLHTTAVVVPQANINTVQIARVLAQAYAAPLAY